MKILSVNAGSSSLKFTLIELPSEEVIASGVFEKIGMDGSFYTIKYNGEKIRKEKSLNDHSVAVSCLMEDLVELHILNNLDEIEGVGHRILHGGQEFSESLILNEDIIKEISKYNELGPLHNPANLMGAMAFMKALPNVVQVGVFDTAFHSSMSEREFLYPVPYSWYEKYGVRKYGFHGTSHRYIDKTMREYLQKDDAKIISCHIGNGASVTAIDSGKVVDTSMGFTPLAGVMMGTRSGDIDPSIIPFVMNKTNMSCEEVINCLNKESGLLGVSCLSSDSRDIEDAMEQKNEMAILAQDIYTQKIANYVAMYNNLLNGADAIVFTAGVGENSSQVRKTVCEKIKSLGVELDLEKNNCRGEFRLISKDDSKIAVYILPTNEELMIALDTMELINKK